MQFPCNPPALWRVPGRGEPWAAPPGSKAWDLLSGEFEGLLKSLPDDIVGVGAENGCVWVALDDARAIIEPGTIKSVLDEILAFLVCP